MQCRSVSISKRISHERNETSNQNDEILITYDKKQENVAAPSLRTRFRKVPSLLASFDM